MTIDELLTILNASGTDFVEDAWEGQNVPETYGVVAVTNERVLWGDNGPAETVIHGSIYLYEPVGALQTAKTAVAAAIAGSGISWRPPTCEYLEDSNMNRWTWAFEMFGG